MTQSKIEQGVVDSLESESQSLLISGCINCIEQCDQVLAIVSAENYSDASRGGAAIGAHMRHILDRFHCFFAGLAESSIDYDARRRDPEIEQNLSAAAFAVATVDRRIRQLGSQTWKPQYIAVREAVVPSCPAVEIPSTLERELMGLITHSTHHLALIVLIARSFGYQLDENFGKAPSTIAFERA